MSRRVSSLWRTIAGGYRSTMLKFTSGLSWTPSTGCHLDTIIRFASIRSRRSFSDRAFVCAAQNRILWHWSRSANADLEHRRQPRQLKVEQKLGEVERPAEVRRLHEQVARAAEAESLLLLA